MKSIISSIGITMISILSSHIIAQTKVPKHQAPEDSYFDQQLYEEFMKSPDTIFLNDPNFDWSVFYISNNHAPETIKLSVADSLLLDSINTILGKPEKTVATDSLDLGFFDINEILTETKRSNSCDYNKDSLITLMDQKLYQEAIDLLQPCADEENPSALNTLGILLIDTKKGHYNPDVGFEYINKAAAQYYEAACYNLGRLYKHGIGCDIDFEKAIASFEQAALLGNERGHYSIGYMYLKGFGVPQDYEKAVAYFSKSNYPMARYWLGVCNYYGYGTDSNPTEAMRLLEESNTANGAALLQKIKQEENIWNQSYKVFDFQKDQNIHPKELKDVWNGTLHQFDWSDDHVCVSSPIKIDFNNEAVTLSYENQEIVAKNQIIGNKLFFENLSINLPYQLPITIDQEYLRYKILSMQFFEETIDQETYVIAELETFIEDWSEPGPSMRMVISPSETKNSLEITKNYNAEIDQSLITYPNAFSHAIQVAITLPRPATMKIELHDIQGVHNRILMETQSTANGTHQKNFNVSQLPKGLYILAVTIDDVLYTRTLTK